MVAILAQLVVSGLLLGGVYSLISLGMTLEYGALKLINFAHGEYLMLAMYLSWILSNAFGLNPYLSIVIVTPVMFAAGCLTYWILIRPVLRSTHLVQVFVTFGLSIVLQNAALIVFGGLERSVNVSFIASVVVLGPVRITYVGLIAFATALAATGVLYLVMRNTYLGKSIRATGQNPLAAQLVGVDVNRARLLTFGLGTGLLGIAGPMLVPMYSTYPTVGSEFILIIFVVMVLGGLGSFQGAVVGGLFVGVVQAVAGYFVASEINQVLLFLLLAGILIYRPSGIFGRERTVGSLGR